MYWVGSLSQYQSLGTQRKICDRHVLQKKIRNQQSHAMRSNAQPTITRVGTVLCGTAIMPTFTEEKPPRINLIAL